MPCISREGVFLPRVFLCIWIGLFSLYPPEQVVAGITHDLLDEANLLYVQEKYAEAREVYQRFIDQSPGNTNKGLAQYLIGNTYAELGDLRHAEQMYQKVGELEEGNEWIDDSLLKIAEFKARFSSQIALNSALKVYTRIIGLYPRGNCALRAHYGKGKIYFRMERWKESEKKLLEILELDPPDQLAVDVLLSLGDFYRTRGNKLYNLQQSIKRYNEILSRYPKSAPYPSTYLALANSYREGKKYPKAISHYKKILDEFPDSFQAPLAQSMLGLCYEESSKIDQSLRAYKTIKKYPASPLLKETVSNREKKVRRLHKDVIQVEADSSNYDSEQGKAKYIGNVTISWNEITFTCEKAVANINKSFILGEGKVVCTSRKDLKITGLLVHFFPKLRKAQFYGDVRILLLDPRSREARVVAQGKKITYDFDSDTYVVDN